MRAPNPTGLAVFPAVRARKRFNVRSLAFTIAGKAKPLPKRFTSRKQTGPLAPSGGSQLQKGGYKAYIMLGFKWRDWYLS
jgi:hypothetical protein